MPKLVEPVIFYVKEIKFPCVGEPEWAPGNESEVTLVSNAHDDELVFVGLPWELCRRLIPYIGHPIPQFAEEAIRRIHGAPELHNHTVRSDRRLQAGSDQG